MKKISKKQIKRYALWVLLVALVAALAVMPMVAQSEQEEEGPQASILTTQAEQGDIQVNIKGGGNLTAGKAMNVTLPSGVQITEFLVSNGDVVTEGTPVARVDRVSVMNAIIAVKESMDYLEKQIDAARDDTMASAVYATAGGRVKQVFAQVGESVETVMLRDGALAVLSLDGLMAVELECSSTLRGGDGVQIVIGDKTVSGRVESNLSGKLVVTVEDKGYAVGQTVEVTLVSGESLGTGELYIHSAWRAIAYGGTIQYVYAKPETDISKGATLFTLKDTDYTGNLESLSRKHREYEELLQRLFVMYDTELLTAPCDGIVSGVDEDSTFLLASGDQPWQIQLLSEGGGPICDGLDETGESCLATEHVEGCYYYCTGLAGCTAKTGEHDATCLSLCVSAELAGECRALRHKQDCVEYCKGAAEVGKCPAVGAHKPGCIESCTESDGSADCPATGAHKDTCLERCDRTESCFATLHHYEDCLALCDKSSTCPALNHKTGCYMAGLTYKAYAVRVKQVGLTELIVAADVQTVYTLSTGSKGWVLEDPKAINNELMITERVVAVSNPSGYKEGDILLFWTGYQGETKVNSGIARYAAGSGSGMNGMGGMSGFGGFGGFGAFGGFGGMAGGSGSQGEDNLFSLDEQVLLTVTDHSSMTLTITLDEHDISSIYLGQKAQVKITALRGQTFEGTVTDIGMEGTNNGGNSKFTVDLELPWNESMLAGMNATATISLETRTGVVRIPVAALVEDRAGTVVYTAVDPDTGELANPVAVTTGVSDGEYVQILSGLELGDTVYYSYYDTLELDHTAKPNTASMFG